MSKRFRGAGILATTLATAMLVSACGGGTRTTGSPPTTSAAGDPAKTVTVAMSVGPTQWDPIATINEVADNMYFSLVYDRLLTVAPDGSLVPQLAESFTVSDDGKEVRLELRPKAVFHDGTPIDAQAVVANLERARAKGGALAQSRLRSVSAIRAVGPATVVLELSEPDGTLLPQLASVALSIASPKAFDGLQTAPVGSGPYTLVSSGAERASFKRFDDYWDGSPRSAGFEIVSISSTPTRINALRSGSVDWIFVNLDAAAEIKQFGADPGFQLEQIPTRSVFSLNVNTDRAPLNDPGFRKAISLATDRAAISTSLLGGMCKPTTQPLGSGEGHVGGIEEPLQRDLERARALVAESGVGDRSFEVAVASGTAAERIAQAMQAQLAEAGITMRIQAFDGRSVRPLFREGKVDALLQQVNAEIDPLIQLQLNYAGPDAPGGTAPELQALLDKVARLDPKSPERPALLDEVSRRLVANPVHVVICAVPNTHIGRADVAGMDDMPMRTVLNPADVRTLMRS